MNQASPITSVILEKAQGLQKVLFANINDTSTSLNDCLQELAQSAAVLEDYAQLQSLNLNGHLDALTALRIALTLSELNQCQSSLALHIASARQAGLNSSEIDSNRAGTSQDAKGAVAVQFAQQLVRGSGHSQKVSPEQWQDIRRAGYSDGEILEIISHVGMHVLGNMLVSMNAMTNQSPPINLKRKSQLSELKELNESQKILVNSELVKGRSTA